MKKIILILTAVLALTVAHNLTNAQTISAGFEHILYVCSNNSAMSCGRNTSGQLGIGSTTSQSTPVQVSFLNGVASVSGGGFFSLFLKSDGTVRACGSNGAGQLGDGTTTSKTLPVQVSSLTGIISIAGGGYHSLFLKNDGTVWACGQNPYGQLGIGSSDNNPHPTAVQISSLSGITAIAAGDFYSLFLKNDSTAWACGENSSGTLGDGTNTDRSTPVQVSSLNGIIAIAAGQFHSLFLKNDGTVWACGYNGYGAFGNGTSGNLSATPVQVNITGAIGIAAGNRHSLFLKSDSTVWACGWNACGQLGLGVTNWDTLFPIQINSLSGIASITARDAHSHFLKSDSTVLSCGCNPYGVLGNGTTANDSTPNLVNGLCSVAMPSSITVHVQEENAFSESFSIFPNPFSSQTTLWTAEQLKNATLTVDNCFGQTVTQIKNINGQTVIFSRDNLASGLYFIRLTEENKTIAVDKLVITDK